MRVTQQMLADTTITNLRSNVSRLQDLENALTTGKRINRPSDDPPAVTRTLTYTSDLSAGDSYLNTIDNSLTWLNTTDDALAEGGSLLQRARELAVEGSNGSLAPQDMANIGVEIGHILDQMIVTGNSSLRGERLFAGDKIDADPFAKAANPAGFTYTGDNAQMQREYDLNAQVTINTDGQATFGPAITALTNLANHLNSGNPSLVSGDIAAIDQALDTVLSARANVGAKVNRLTAAQDRQSLLQVNLEGLRSKVADTDYADALSKFTIQENVYKASLQVGGQALQPSLLDYLK
jgi:flagellar hook-associated protein 3 FlgL